MDGLHTQAHVDGVYLVELALYELQMGATGFACSLPELTQNCKTLPYNHKALKPVGPEVLTRRSQKPVSQGLDRLRREEHPDQLLDSRLSVEACCCWRKLLAQTTEEQTTSS